MRTPRLPGSVVVLGLALCSWVAASCGDSNPAGPRLGAVEVTAVTTGADIDPDGYIVTVDGGNGPAVGPNDIVVYPDVVAGTRTVELTGLAENCTASNNPRTVDVDEGETARETFHVVCAPLTGTIEIDITTSGPGPGGSCGAGNVLCDPDGYELTVNGVGQGAVDINDEVILSGLEAGEYQLTLTNVAEACTVADGPTRTVTVTAGAPAEVDFAITCTFTTGVIDVDIATTGPGPGGSCGTNNILCDPDGYRLTLNGADRGAVGINGELLLTDLEPGDYEVALSGVSEGCTVADGATRIVGVTAGDTAHVAFNVTCTSPLPVITFLESPATVSNDLFASHVITVGFADADGDIVTAEFQEVSDPSNIFDPFEVDLDVSGQTQGSFRVVTWICLSIPECPTGAVTASVVLVDQAGHRSEPVNFSFEVVD